MAIMKEVSIFLDPPMEERRIMGTIVYNKLLAMMEQKGLTTYKIRKEKIISESTLQKIRQNKSITTDSIASLCEVLNCQPGDIMEYIPDQPQSQEGA